MKFMAYIGCSGQLLWYATKVYAGYATMWDGIFSGVQGNYMMKDGFCGTGRDGFVR